MKDFFSHWFQASGIPAWLDFLNAWLALPAVGAAIWQARSAWTQAKKASAATEATRMATRETVQRVSRNQLITTISSATTLISSLSESYKNRKIDSMENLWRDWQLMLSAVLVLIRETRGPDLELQSAAQESSAATLKVLSALRRNDEDLPAALDTALEAADRVWTQLAEISTQLGVGGGRFLGGQD